MKKAVLVLAMSAGLLSGTRADVPAPPPAPGISARYPGDEGIEKDPDVLFVSQFEEDSVAGAAKRWTEAKGANDGVLVLSGDVPPGSPGKKSLQMTATKGKNTGGHLWKLLKPGVDEMYARFYVKFSKDHPYVHHFVKIGAWKDSPNWPQGEAGHRHDGAKSFQTGIEPGSEWGKRDPPGAWFFYTYWQGMRSWQGPKGTSFYGNAFAPAAAEQVPRDQWQCVEFMVKANTAPEKSDGEQAFWIDGRLAGRWAPGTPTGKWVKDRFVEGPGAPFEGFCWRTDGALKINTFWLLYYMESVFKGDSQFKPRPGVAYNANVGTVWFDHVVLARKPIGPLQKPLP
ncbi:MAG: hypothetical protein AAB215_02220 [Planctomycetota bacterium]